MFGDTYLGKTEKVNEEIIMGCNGVLGIIYFEKIFNSLGVTWQVIEANINKSHEKQMEKIKKRRLS